MFFRRTVSSSRVARLTKWHWKRPTYWSVPTLLDVSISANPDFNASANLRNLLNMPTTSTTNSRREQEKQRYINNNKVWINIQMNATIARRMCTLSVSSIWVCMNICLHIGREKRNLHDAIRSQLFFLLESCKYLLLKRFFLCFRLYKFLSNGLRHWVSCRSSLNVRYIELENKQAYKRL